MKRRIKSILLLGAFVPFFSQADVNVTLHKDVEALLVNGEELPLSFLTKKKFKLANGINQLVVRMSKLIENRGQYEKFNTDLLVITFSASDSSFTISPSRKITAERQVNDFKQNPSFDLINAKGNKISSKQQVLPISRGLVQNYEKDIIKFNAKHGYQIGDYSINTMAAVAPVVTNASTKNKLILMQADYLRMSAKERQVFLDWAVKNVGS